MLGINDFTTALAVLHLVTLVRWRPPIAKIRIQKDSHVTTDSHGGNTDSWAFTVNCSGITHAYTCTMYINVSFLIHVCKLYK